MLRRIAELVFVEVLRSRPTTAFGNGAGWLGGLRDPVVGRALACLHADPPEHGRCGSRARGWRVRSVLAERFAALVGHPPMLYLTHWRMQLAGSLLSAAAAPVGAVAADVGYESEAAFCRAFKKVAGVTPAAWRSRRRAGA